MPEDRQAQGVIQQLTNTSLAERNSRSRRRGKDPMGIKILPERKAGKLKIESIIK